MLLQTESIPTLEEKFRSWLHGFEMRLPEIVLAIVVLIIVLILSRYVHKLTTKFYHRRSDNPAIATVMASFFSILFILFGFFIALGILGLDQTVSSLLAGAGILGIILGLALQDTLSSAIAGIVMTQRKSYKVGDFVESNNFRGVIVEINLRNTTIRQTNGTDVKIPNKLVLNTPLINYTLTGERRVELTILITNDADAVFAISIIKEAVQKIPSLNPEKPVEVFFNAITSTGTEVLVRFWIKKIRQADYRQAKTEALIAIKKTMDVHGIQIPNQQYVVEMKK